MLINCLLIIGFVVCSLLAVMFFRGGIDTFIDKDGEIEKMYVIKSIKRKKEKAK